MKPRSQPRIWRTGTYDRFARFYDAFMRLAFPKGQKGRAVIVEKLSAGTVLDVACGTGTLLAMACEKGLKRFGVDLSRGMLAQAKVKAPGAALCRASFYQLPHPDDCFDYVAATNALSSESIDAHRALAEMIRVCKPGGKVYIAEWPMPEEAKLLDRLLIKLANFFDDAPKDYLNLFHELGYEPIVHRISKAYHVFDIKKTL